MSLYKSSLPILSPSCQVIDRMSSQLQIATQLAKLDIIDRPEVQKTFALD
jgi:hypothetical protein